MQQWIIVFGIQIFAWSNERLSGYLLVSEIYCHNSFPVRLNEYPDSKGIQKQWSNIRTEQIFVAALFIISLFKWLIFSYDITCRWFHYKSSSGISYSILLTQKLPEATSEVVYFKKILHVDHTHTPAKKQCVFDCFLTSLTKIPTWNFYTYVVITVDTHVQLTKMHDNQ